ncbi:hypothetical protein [Ferrovibrio sp.]|uniref:hypothetical protein n=1 Tax=Ferrovibrio sp. TaxID=1917215 RepID=UPI0035B41FC5
MKNIYIFSISIFLISTPASESRAQIVIGDDPIDQAEAEITLPLVGLRPFPTDFLVQNQITKDKKWAVDASVFYTAAKFQTNYNSNNKILYYQLTADISDQDVVSAINTLKTNSVPLPDILTLYTNQPEKAGTAKYYPVDVQVIKTIANKVETHGGAPLIFDYKNQQGKTSKAVWLETGYAKELAAVYSENDKYKEMQLPNVFKVAGNTAKAHSTLSGSLSVDVDWITIGKPLVFPAADKSLKIEPSIQKSFDVYFFQFAMSPRKDPKSTGVLELTFAVKLSNHSAVAFEIIPLRTGIERSVSENTKTPEIKIETPAGAGVTVGEVYGQKIEYKTLKPTVIGNGLQESTFGWTVKDEALDSSAKRFIAIIGVPKRTKNLTAEIAISSRVKGGWLQEDHAATKLHNIKIDLPN